MMDDIKIIDGVEYAPLRTAYWVEVQSKNPTTATVHRCSNPECRLTTYAHRLPPYCQECGSKMLGKVREDDDKYLMQAT
jgi:DNA-directed RNA polymerase subunit RPC12/RpoP